MIEPAPPAHQRRIATPFLWITLAVVAVILYGSLYPFTFHSRPGSPLRALLATYGLRDSRGDIVANVLLYLPLGFFAIRTRNRRRTAVWQVAAITFAGALLSAGIELLQFYIPGRDSALADLGSNTLGTFLGAAAGMLARTEFGLNVLKPGRHLSSGLILACWIGYRLFPYAPVIDLHKYWHAVRPLLVEPVLPAGNLYRHTVTWLALALVLDELCEGAWRRFVFPLFVLFVLGARIVIIDAVLSPSEVAGAAIAITAWFVFLHRRSARAAAVFLLFVVLVILQALEPFRFSATPRPFTWIPFSGFLHGSIAVNVQSFLEKSFLYGSLVWLGVRAGLPWRVVVLTCGSLVFALRFLQVYIPERSAEISDVVILLMMSGLIRLADREALAHDGVAHGRVGPAD